MTSTSGSLAKFYFETEDATLGTVLSGAVRAVSYEQAYNKIQSTYGLTKSEIQIQVV